MSELQSQHAAWKAVRARLDGPKNVIALVPPTERPAQDVMDIIVAGVANALELQPVDILAGVSEPEIISARRLAMALCVRRPRFGLDRVADYFEVNPDAISNGLKQLDPILNAYVMTAKTPLELCLPIIVREWKNGEIDRLRPTIRQIQDATCEAFSIKRVDMLSARREKHINRPRLAGMALAKHLTLCSLPIIGRAFGGRDHTTVLHACRRVEPVINSLIEKVSPGSSPLVWAKLLAMEMTVVQLAPYARYDRRATSCAT